MPPRRISISHKKLMENTHGFAVVARHSIPTKDQKQLTPGGLHMPIGLEEICHQILNFQYYNLDLADHKILATLQKQDILERKCLTKRQRRFINQTKH